MISSSRVDARAISGSRLLSLVTGFLGFSVHAADCNSLLKATSELQLKTAGFLQSTQAPLLINVCRDEEPRVFEQFYAHLNKKTTDPGIVPKASLTRIKPLITPEHNVFTTGVVAFKTGEYDTYQIRIRVRINGGAPADLSVDLQAMSKAVVQDKDNKFIVSLTDLGTLSELPNVD